MRDDLFEIVLERSTRACWRHPAMVLAVCGALTLAGAAVLMRVTPSASITNLIDPCDPAARAFIDLAERGFKVSARLNRSIASDRYLSQYPAARGYFFDHSGRPLAVGSVLRNPALARTLRAVARGGANAFYRGAIARDVALATRADKRRPGLMTMGDLVAYRVKLRPTICGPYRSWLVCGFGPPTAGGIATVMTLALVERFDLARLGPGSVEAVHLISEATRLVNADRLRYVADPDFVSVPVSGLLDRGYLGRRSQRIRRGRAMGKVRPGRIPMLAQSMERAAASMDFEPPSTTHLSVVDAQGNAVAMTASVGGAFGSRIMVRGFMLNNEATDFSPVPRTPIATRTGSFLTFLAQRIGTLVPSR